MPTILDRVISSVKAWSRKDDPAFQSYVQFLGLGNPIYTPKDYYEVAKQGYERNVTVYRAISLIAQSCAGIPWKLYQKRGKLVELQEHPLLDLLTRPNPNHSQGEFLEQMISFWILSGNCYICTVRPNAQATPSELWILRPDRMRVVPGISTIVGYEYYVNSLRSYFQATDILHLKMFAATNDWYGLSPVMVAGALIDQSNEGFDWNTALIQNAGRPSGALVAQGTLANDQYERLRRIIRERYIGKKNAGMPMLLEGGIEWKPFSMSPMELDWGESRKQNARDIAIAIGVPPELIGDHDNATYSNYQEARKSFYQETVLPLMDKLRDRLNVWLVSQYGNDLYLNYDKDDIEALQEDRDSLSTRLISQWDAGIVTLNEVRMGLGLEELTGGDVLQLTAQGRIFVPIASLTEIVEKKLEDLMTPPPAAPPPGPAQPTQVPDQDMPLQDTAGQSQEVGPEQNVTSGKSQRDPVVEKATAVLVSYLTREKEQVLTHLLKAALPETTLLRMKTGLSACREDRLAVLSSLFLTLAEDSWKRTGNQFLQEKTFTPEFLLQQGVKAYLKQQADAAASSMEDSSRLALSDALSYGIAQGESIEELAERVQGVYETDLLLWKAKRVAQTEATAAINFGARVAAIGSGQKLQKQWLSKGDGHVRPAHQIVDPTDLFEPFQVDGEKLMFPGDKSMGASPKNTVNCRCSTVFVKEQKQRDRIDSLLEDPKQAFTKKLKKVTPYQEFQQLLAENSKEKA